MSTFSGVIKEIDGISVDNFLSFNLESKAFFLSHCHLDHMKGLWKGFAGPLYLSETSAVIVRRMYPKIALKPLLVGREYC